MSDTVAPQWADDPYQRHQLRYWDGQVWTEHVLDGSTPGLDPIHQTDPVRSEHTTNGRSQQQMQPWAAADGGQAAAGYAMPDGDSRTTRTRRWKPLAAVGVAAVALLAAVQATDDGPEPTAITMPAASTSSSTARPSGSPAKATSGSTKKATTGSTQATATRTTVKPRTSAATARTTSTAAKATATLAPIAPAVPQKPKATTTTATSKPTTSSKVTAGVDRRYKSCKAAIAAGLGPYRQGVDPEYHWYRDADNDGIVCERR
jgi:hypothetical protein